MSIMRSRGALIGTSETSGVSLTNGSTAYTGGGTVTSDVDIFGDDISVGDIWIYVVFTSTANGGTIDVTITPHRNTGQGYLKLNPEVQIPIINGTQLVPLGKRPCERYMAAKAFNNGGATVTGLAILYSAEKLS